MLIQPKSFLAHRYQIVSGFAVWIVREFQTHRTAGDEKFFAAAGVFNMDGLVTPWISTWGDKTNWTVYKKTVHDFSVFHSLEIILHVGEEDRQFFLEYFEGHDGDFPH